MAFLDDNYLITNETGKRIFNAVKDLPVIDPHNHADVKEIADNNCYSNAWQLFAATDHYVWELLRKRGVPEELITGKADPRSKFLAMAKVFPETAGNPLYEWIHLDLRRYFGIDLLLNEENGPKIWEEVNAKLATDAFRPQALLTGPLNVEAMSSTDDLIDTLENHDRANKAFGRTLIRPTWRPDKAMKIFAPGWRDYIGQVEKRFDMKIETLSDLLDATKKSHDFFAEHGCRASDHGIEYPVRADYRFEDADAAFRKALSGKELTQEETDCYMGTFLAEAAALNAETGWVTQLHIGAVRDVRKTLFDALGPDVGGDVSSHFIDYTRPLATLLNRFDGKLKVVLYCMDAIHQMSLATLARAFGETVSLGSAWWLNDNPIGMRRQLEYIGSIDALANFAGMVSDSRKLLSYGSRFEMFRRVLSDVIGDMVERGQIPEEVATDLAVRNLFSEEFLSYLEDFHFTGDIYAMPEGTPVFPREPMVIVRAKAIEAQLIETFTLLTINHQSLIATKANRIARAARGRTVLEFGSRRAQGADAAIIGARAAYIGGVAGTACTISDQIYGVPAGGTMAHAWVQMFDSEYDAFKTYCQIYPHNATLLVDTYNTLKSGVPNAIRAFNEVLKPMGITKCGIRLDSGDMAYLTRKARKMLDEAGWTECQISVSNSLDEYLIQDLLLQDAKIDLFGVGERMITAKSEPVFGGVYKLAAVEDQQGNITPKIKISENVEKITIPHFKKVYRFYGNDTGKAIADYITVYDETLDDTKDLEIFDPSATWKKKTVYNFTARPLLVPVFLGGKRVYDSPSLPEIQAYCRQQVDTLWDEVKRFDNPHSYYVDLSDRLWNIQQDLLRNR